MRRLARLLLAAGAIAALLAALRKLLEGRAEPQQAGSRAEQGRNGASDLTREQLYEKAKRLEIEGRSKMNKRQLARAVAEREAGR